MADSVVKQIVYCWYFFIICDDLLWCTYHWFLLKYLLPLGTFSIGWERWMKLIKGSVIKFILNEWITTVRLKLELTCRHEDGALIIVELKQNTTLASCKINIEIEDNNIHTKI